MGCVGCGVGASVGWVVGGLNARQGKHQSDRHVLTCRLPGSRPYIAAGRDLVKRPASARDTTTLWEMGGRNDVDSISFRCKCCRLDSTHPPFITGERCVGTKLSDRKASKRERSAVCSNGVSKVSRKCVSVRARNLRKGWHQHIFLPGVILGKTTVKLEISCECLTEKH